MQARCELNNWAVHDISLVTQAEAPGDVTHRCRSPVSTACNPYLPVPKLYLTLNLLNPSPLLPPASFPASAPPPRGIPLSLSTIPSKPERRHGNISWFRQERWTVTGTYKDCSRRRTACYVTLNPYADPHHPGPCLLGAPCIHPHPPAHARLVPARPIHPIVTLERGGRSTDGLENQTSPRVDPCNPRGSNPGY